MAGKPYTPDELAAINRFAASPRSGYGALKRLALELGRSYHSISVRVFHARCRGGHRRCEPRQVGAMIDSGESYRNLMKRIHGEE